MEAEVFTRDQLQFSQRLILPKQSDIAHCISEKSTNGHSIFDCFASVVHVIRHMHMKSVHLHHTCPLTDFHSSCGDEPKEGHNHCLCVNRNVPSHECDFIHISTHFAKYLGARNLSEFDEAARTSQCELSLAFSS